MVETLPDPLFDRLIYWLKRRILTRGCGRMEEPLNRLATWIGQQSCPKVTLICPDSEPRRIICEILDQAEIQYEAVEDQVLSPSVSRHTLEIPPLRKRLEDLPIIVDWWVRRYSDVNLITVGRIPVITLAFFAFLCCERHSPTGVQTPCCSYDELIGLLKRFLERHKSDCSECATVVLERNPEGVSVKALLHPFILLDDTSVTLPLENFRNLTYRTEDNHIEASKLAPDYDLNGRPIPNLTISMRSVLCAEFRHIFWPSLANSQLAHEQSPIGQLQQTMTRLIRMLVQGMTDCPDETLAYETLVLAEENFRREISCASDFSEFSIFGEAFVPSDTQKFAFRVIHEHHPNRVLWSTISDLIEKDWRKGHSFVSVSDLFKGLGNIKVRDSILRALIKTEGDGTCRLANCLRIGEGQA